MDQTPAPSTLHVVTRLRTVLETIGDALASGAYDRLVEAEAELAAALPDRSLARRTGDGTARLAREIQSARRALVRARRLGASLADVVRISLHTQGRDPEYGRDGAHPASNDTGSLDRRV